MVEGGDQSDTAREQHAVPEHVARHVSDPDDRNRVRIDIDVEFHEVTTHRLPRSPGGDPEGLVVVAGRPTGCESVIKPEPGIDGDLIRGVREGRCSPVGGHDEVRIVTIEGANPRRVNNVAVFVIVSHVEKCVDEDPVAGLHFIERRARGRIGDASHHKPALRSGRHDDDVLRHLSLHQTQDLGSIVLASVRPADATPRHGTATQVDTCNLWCEHEDLVHRSGFGSSRDL